MADTIKISELTALNSGSTSANDVLPMTNDGDDTTYKVSLDSIDYYIKTSPNSRKFTSGSSQFANIATSSLSSSHLIYTGINNGTASYALNSLTSSFTLSSSIAISSSFAVTASYIKTINYAEVETASFAKSSSLLLYNPIRSNGTASHAISSSFARTASFASGSNIFALSSSYSLSSSFTPSASYAVSSSYIETSSYSSTSSISTNSITSSYVSSQFLTKTLSSRYMVALPSSFLSSGSINYIIQQVAVESRGLQVHKIDTKNNNVTFITDLEPNENFNWTNASMVSSSYTGNTYFTLTTNTSFYLIPYNNFISQSIVEYNSPLQSNNYARTIVDIDDSNLSLPTVYGVHSDNSRTLTDIEAVAWTPPATAPENTKRQRYTRAEIGSATSLNFFSAPKPEFPNSASFYKFEPVSNKILFFYFNAKKRRFYLSTSNTGFLHIFNINSYYNTVDINAQHFKDWWTNPNRLDYFTYEKTIAIQDNGESIGTDEYEHLNIEFDPQTGQELYINFCKRGRVNFTGTVFKVPWVE